MRSKPVTTEHCTRSECMHREQVESHRRRRHRQELADVVRQRDELLAALERLLPETVAWRRGEPDEETVAAEEQARAAIAKAKGGVEA